MNPTHKQIEEKVDEFAEIEVSYVDGKRVTYGQIPNLVSNFREALTDIATQAHKAGVEEALGVSTPLEEYEWGCLNCGGSMCADCKKKIEDYHSLTQHK